METSPLSCPVHYSTGLAARQPTAFWTGHRAGQRRGAYPPRPRATQMRSLELGWPATNSSMAITETFTIALRGVGVSLTCCCWEQNNTWTRAAADSVAFGEDRRGSEPGDSGSDSVGNEEPRRATAPAGRGAAAAVPVPPPVRTAAQANPWTA